MSTPSRTSLLRRLIGLPGRSAVHEDDAADMGTAIGLDYSLDQAPIAKTKPAPVNKLVSRQAWARRRHS
jgi:hypothetical protein